MYFVLRGSVPCQTTHHIQIPNTSWKFDRGRKEGILLFPFKCLQNQGGYYGLIFSNCLKHYLPFHTLVQPLSQSKQL